MAPEADYIDENEDEELEGQQPEDDHDEDGASDDEPAAAGAEGQPPKKTRREKQAARVGSFKELQAELAEQRRANAELLRRVAESADATRRVAEGFQQDRQRAAQPAPVPFRDRAAKRLAEAAAAIRQDDPTTIERYHRVQAELLDEGADERAAARVAEVEQRIRKNMPLPPTPEQQRVMAIAPWAFEPLHHDNIVNVANRIAAEQGVQGDLFALPAASPVRRAIVDKAIGDYAAWAKLEANLPRRAAANPGAVAGASARTLATGTGSSGTPAALTDEVRRMADNHPKFAGIKNEAKRHAKFYREMVEPYLPKS